VFQRRPVGLWTTRSTEFPTSPTGLHYYYEFRQSSSTQNDEGPDFAMNHMDLLTGYVDIAKVRGVTSPDYRVFSIRDPIICHHQYLLYLFQMGYKNRIFYAYGQGSSQLGRWRMPTEQFYELAFPLPPVPEQTQIAAFLDHETAKIDALVAEQRRLMDLLKEKRKAVISHAVTKGLNPDAPMKPSGIEWLGDVPEHWEVVPLKKLVTESVAGPYGASLTKGMYCESGYRVYGQQQVIPDDFTIGDYCIDQEKYLEMQRYTVFPGDVLISVMGTIGQVAVVPDDVAAGIINPRLVRYRCGSRIKPRYLQQVLMSRLHQEHLLFESKGSTMNGLNMQTIGAVPVPFPSLSEQDVILNYVAKQAKQFDALTAEAQRAIDLLQERRTALISAAVTGQIDVRGAALNSHPHGA